MGSSSRRLSGNIGNSRLSGNFVEPGFVRAKALSNLWLTVPTHAIIQWLCFLLFLCAQSGWGSCISSVHPSSLCLIRDLTQRMSGKVSFSYVRILKVIDSVSFGFIKWMQCGEMCLCDSLAICMFYFRSNSSSLDDIWHLGPLVKFSAEFHFSACWSDVNLNFKTRRSNFKQFSRRQSSYAP
jgi:hypothetical protein